MGFPVKKEASGLYSLHCCSVKPESLTWVTTWKHNALANVTEPKGGNKSAARNQHIKGYVDGGDGGGGILDAGTRTAIAEAWRGTGGEKRGGDDKGMKMRPSNKGRG